MSLREGALGEGTAGAALFDPLARLPVPADDRTLLRTFPGRPDTGSVRWEPVAAFPGLVRFHARLPERYGDVGFVEARGLWANGGWYPQVEGVPVLDWDVSVDLPRGVVGALNGTVGEGRLRWRGRADRVAFAALFDGVVDEIAVAGGTVRVLQSGRVERGLARQIARVVDDAWPLKVPPDLTVVEDLDLLRVARTGPGTVYLSERAFRLFPGLARYHRRAVRDALLSAAVPRPDAWERDFVAEALAGTIPAPSARKLLALFSWNPFIDALLYDGTLPYFSDIFDEPFGGPPGLWESLSPRIPGRVAALQLDDLRGDGSALALAHLLLGGASFDAAADALALPGKLVEGWKRPYPAGQDYVARRGEVARVAPPDAPPEVVIVEVDGVPLAPWIAETGSLAVDGRRVRVDPAGHTLQADRSNDRWPARWTTVVNGGFYGVSPSQGNFDFSADLVFRRQGDSRGLWILSGSHDAQDLVSLDVTVVRYLGPLLDRRTRQHRVYAWGGPALLDPGFRPTDAGAVAVGGGVQYTWDTRTDDFFALRGHRLTLGVSGGAVPGSEETWAGASASATKLFALHPRHVLAVRAKAGWASGEVEHRLLPLGGNADVRGIAETAVVGNERLVLSAEYRLALLRNVSVPVGLGWLSELHVSPGIEGGALWRDGERHAALAPSLGIHALTELAGAKPSLAGLTFALPVWTGGFHARRLQYYIDFNHSF